MAELINAPPKSEYKKSSNKVFFSYPGNQDHFQINYLGVNPNSIIAGTLHLRFPSSEPILASKIDLIFKGSEKVHWTERHGESTVTYKAKNVFVNQLLPLWKTSDPNGNYEEIRNLDIPFEISLPMNLPPSIKIDGGKGKIRYKLIANINRKGNLWKFKGSEKSVKLSINIIRFFPPSLSLQPFNWNQLYDHEALTRGLGYNATLENSVGGPNMPFIINLSLKFHKQDFKITKITFGIKEYHKLTTKRKTRKSKSYILEKHVKAEELPLNSDSEVNTQVKLEIPRNFCWTIDDRKHIDVNHKVKIKIHCGGIFTSNIKLGKEVEIRNILLENYNYDNYNYNNDNNYTNNDNYNNDEKHAINFNG
ncbi:hypothetical protein RclHR1_06760004 [Rhizophagus clarus]|uniref:Arrestin domain-containing protein 17-like n=1 Tax=Rhizophagus clarus TaxID=94130 RepID=A0A2Z6SJS8_9GLOM|nr:hypothetical protein RclHR1_06760004 [Rhizophagus clarus]GES80330.1 arrestin domain-containing protein 17-like [Rhizophagus clarus]